jgi:hypothetical protein
MSDNPDVAVATLDPLSEDELYAELGERLKAIGARPDLSGTFNLQERVASEPMGLVDDVKAFGQRFFARTQEQAFELVCGTEAEDRQLRKHFTDALGLGKEATAATLASLLVLHLGLAPAIAPVVALLIVRLFFAPAKGAMCDLWRKKIKGPAKDKGQT